jgi:hypothetical protein
MEKFKTVKVDNQIDKRKFYGVEFIINELDQICPFLGFKLKEMNIKLFGEIQIFQKIQCIIIHLIKHLKII